MTADRRLVDLATELRLVTAGACAITSLSSHFSTALDAVIRVGRRVGGVGQCPGKAGRVH